MALQPRRTKTDWSGCCQKAVQGGLVVSKALSLNLNFSFLNRIWLLLISSSYPIVLTRLGVPRSRPYTSWMAVRRANHYTKQVVDMSPDDYDLFPKVKESFRGTRYKKRNEHIFAIERSIRNINEDGRSVGVRRLANMSIKVINRARIFMQMHVFI